MPCPLCPISAARWSQPDRTGSDSHWRGVSLARRRQAVSPFFSLPFAVWMIHAPFSLPRVEGRKEEDGGHGGGA